MHCGTLGFDIIMNRGIVLFVLLSAVTLMQCNALHIDNSLMAEENSPSRVVRSTSHTDEEILAQASCQALATQQDDYGRVYAVGRQCTFTAGTCDEICVSENLTQQDYQTVNSVWSALGAFHIYPNHPSTTFGSVANPVQGLKSKREPTNVNACGPNFCCCLATN